MNILDLLREDNDNTFSINETVAYKPIVDLVKERHIDGKKVELDYLKQDKINSLEEKVDLTKLIVSSAHKVLDQYLDYAVNSKNFKGQEYEETYSIVHSELESAVDLINILIQIRALSDDNVDNDFEEYVGNSLEQMLGELVGSIAQNNEADEQDDGGFLEWMFGKLEDFEPEDDYELLD